MCPLQENLIFSGIFFFSLSLFAMFSLDSGAGSVFNKLSCDESPAAGNSSTGFCPGASYDKNLPWRCRTGCEILPDIGQILSAFTLKKNNNKKNASLSDVLSLTPPVDLLAEVFFFISYSMKRWLFWVYFVFFLNCELKYPAIFFLFLFSTSIFAVHLFV